MAAPMKATPRLKASSDSPSAALRGDEHTTWPMLGGMVHSTGGARLEKSAPRRRSWAALQRDRNSARAEFARADMRSSVTA